MEVPSLLKEQFTAINMIPLSKQAYIFSILLLLILPASVKEVHILKEVMSIEEGKTDAI